MAALVWQAETARACSGCGLPHEETTAIDADGSYKAHAIVCHACKAKDEAAKAWSGSSSGLFWRVD